MNNRMQLEEQPFTFFHVKLMLLVFGAHMIDGYALGIVGHVIVALNEKAPLTPYIQGLVGSSALAGLFLGSLLLGQLADRRGRNVIFMTSFIFISLASVAQYFYYDATSIIFWRFILGIGIGGDYAVGLTLLAEFLPQKHRGVVLGLFSPVWTIGYIIASMTGGYFVGSNAEAINLQLSLPAIPALLILILRLGIPESPIWLISKGRQREASAILKKFFSHSANITLSVSKNTVGYSGFHRLFAKEIWRKTLFSSLFFVCIVVPYFAVYTFFPILTTKLNLPVSINGIPGLELFLFFGALFGLYFVWRFSRRTFTLSCFTILFISLVVLSQASTLFVMGIAFAVFTLVISAISNLTGVYLPECFPTELRSTGVGFSTAISRIGAALGTFLLPILVDEKGIEATLLLLSGVLLVGLLASWRLAPETRDATLA